VPEQTLLGQLLQLVEVHDIASLGVDLPFDGQLQLVVVPMEIRIAALSERVPVPLVRKPGVMKSVSGVEVHTPGYAAAGHEGYELWARGYGQEHEVVAMKWKLLGPRNCP